MFLENKSGRLSELTRVWGKQHQYPGLSIADTEDFGILRLIVNDPEKARQVLKERGFTVSETKIIAVEIPDARRVGKGLEILETHAINIEYIYALPASARGMPRWSSGWRISTVPSRSCRIRVLLPDGKRSAKGLPRLTGTPANRAPADGGLRPIRHPATGDNRLYREEGSEKVKVVAFNGSPRKNGNTVLLLRRVMQELEKEGITTELVQVGGQPIRGCMACYQCRERKDRRCIYNDDKLNEWIGKMLEADGVLIGSPTYFAGLTPRRRP